MAQVIIGVEQEPRIQFKFDMAETGRLPDLILLPDGTKLMFVGKYLSPHEHYAYRRVRSEMTFDLAPAPWPEHTELTGG